MGFSIRMKQIIPKPLNIPEMLAMLAQGIQAEGEAEQKEYRKTTATWRNKPDHELEFSQTKQEIKASNITNDKIYFFLHEGTKVRYAVLSRDWLSKTTPGRLSSGPGRGRVLFISKKFPRPGIEARKWTPVIVRKRKKPYKKNMEAIMVKIAEKTNKRGQA